MSVQPAKNGVCDSSNGNHILDFEHEGTVDGNMRLLVEWLNHILPDLNLSLEASVEDLRACLIDGTVLCSILNKLSPGLIEMRGDSNPGPDKVKKFLAAMDELGLSMFVLEDMQEGYMVPVLQCLERLKSHFDNTDRKENILNHLRMRWNLPDIKSSKRTDHYQEDTSPCAEKSSLYGEWQRSSTNVKSPPCTIYSTVTSANGNLHRR